MRAIVGQHGVDLVGHGRNQVAQEITGDAPSGLFVQLDEGGLRGPINPYEQIELALFGADLGDVDVKIADRIGLELSPLRLVALDFRQSRDVVALQAAMQ